MADCVPYGLDAASLAAQGLRVGCAGWSIPRQLAGEFPAWGSHLERYGAVFDAVEIDSSFYRSHRHATYLRWAASVPEHFRFAVKLPRVITHERRLRGSGELLQAFCADVQGLGRRLGCLLVQLPPGLPYHRDDLATFLDELRRHHHGAVALEPRHASWFEGAASVQLAAHGVARVAADPAPGRCGGWPAGDRALSYFRLHGTPRMYHSPYGRDALVTLASRLLEARRLSAVVWCIFDNTALGAAPGDALAVQAMLRGSRADARLSRDPSLAPATGMQP